MATSTAIFAGHFFLGLEDLLRGLPGVLSTRIAYMGPDVHSPVDRDNPGHAVAVEVTYDSERTDYRSLVDSFFQDHNRIASRDGGRGSAVYYLDNDQSHIARRDPAEHAQPVWKLGHSSDFGGAERTTGESRSHG